MLWSNLFNLISRSFVIFSLSLGRYTSNGKTKFGQEMFLYDDIIKSS